MARKGGPSTELSPVPQPKQRKDVHNDVSKVHRRQTSRTSYIPRTSGHRSTLGISPSLPNSLWISRPKPGRQRAFRVTSLIAAYTLRLPEPSDQPSWKDTSGHSATGSNILGQDKPRRADAVPRRKRDSLTEARFPALLDAIFLRPG